MRILVPSIVFGIGLVLTAVIVVLGWVVVPNIIEDKIEDETRLVEDADTETWGKWQEPIPVYLKFTFFNITNPRAILEGAKPIIEEVGPYVYEEKRIKTVTGTDPDADTVTYHQNITYFFHKEMSHPRTEDDLINAPNGAFMIVSTVVFIKLGPGTISRSLIEALVADGESFVKENVRVGDVVFAGFPISPIYEVIFMLGGIPIPPEFEGMRFGYYRGKNGTQDGEYVIRAGVKDSTQFGQIQKWDDKTELDWWFPPGYVKPDPPEKPMHTSCNMISGTDGSIFRPFIKKDTILQTFISDVCRSTTFEFKKEIDHLGIPGYQFGFPANFYEAADKNPENVCFCPTPPANLFSECKGGAVRLFPCKTDGPIVTSSPHFLGAWTGYQDNVTGLNPQQHLHETYIHVEPNSGMMLKIVKRVQINLELQPLESFTYFDVISAPMMIPVFWAEETVAIDQEEADKLKSKLITPLKILEIGKWTGLGVGCLLVGISLGLFIMIVIRRN